MYDNVATQLTIVATNIYIIYKVALCIHLVLLTLLFRLVYISSSKMTVTIKINVHAPNTVEIITPVPRLLPSPWLVVFIELNASKFIQKPYILTHTYTHVCMQAHTHTHTHSCMHTYTHMISYMKSYTIFKYEIFKVIYA